MEEMKETTTTVDNGTVEKKENEMKKEAISTKIKKCWKYAKPIVLVGAGIVTGVVIGRALSSVESDSESLVPENNKNKSDRRNNNAGPRPQQFTKKQNEVKGQQSHFATKPVDTGEVASTATTKVE